MPHANETTLRNAYAAFARGDLNGFYALCRPEIQFHVPGSGVLSGSRRWPEFLQVLGPAMEAINNSFREEILHLAANDTDGFVMVVQQADRDGRTYRWNAVHHYRIEGGKLAEFREFTDDQTTFDRAWRK
jgi:ketosteroid isomerase-like protein